MTQAVATVDTGILQRAGVKVTPTSLTLTDKTISYEQIEEIFGFVGTVEQSCFWWTADLLNQAEGLYGEVFSQLESATRLSAQTLTNRASIGRRIPPSRRRPNVPPALHCEVAYLDPREQDEWLDAAEAGGWSRSQLREQIKGPSPHKASLRELVEDAVREATRNQDGSWSISSGAYDSLCQAVGMEE